MPHKTYQILEITHQNSEYYQDVPGLLRETLTGGKAHDKDSNQHSKPGSETFSWNGSDDKNTRKVRHE